MGCSTKALSLWLLALSFVAAANAQNSDTTEEGKAAEVSTGQGQPLAEVDTTTQPPIETSTMGQWEEETTTDSSRTTPDEHSSSASENKSSSLWNKLTCLLTGFFPFRIGCPADKKDPKEGSSTPHVHGIIMAIEERGESEQTVENNGGDEEKKRGGESGSEEAGGENAAGEDDDQTMDEVKVSAVVVETTTNEEGQPETNIEQIEAEGTIN